MKNLCTLGPQAYRLLHRTVACEYCGAGAGEKCIGEQGRPIEECHLHRKRELAAWRREYPARWRLLRQAVAAGLLDRLQIPS